MRKGHVSNDSFSKKSGRAVFRSVEKLVRHEKFSRPQIFLQRPDRAHRDDALHSQKLHRVDVCAVVDFAGQDAMPAAVPRQKRNALSLKRTKHYGIRRLAERRSHANLRSEEHTSELQS